MNNETTSAATDLARELFDQGLISGTLSSPRKNTDSFDKIRIRRISLSSGEAYQLEQFRSPKVFHVNLRHDETEEFLGEQIGTVYGRAEFRTETTFFTVMTNRRGKVTILRKNVDADSAQGPMPAKPKATDTETLGKSHNRAKKYILPEGSPIPFLVHLGVMTPEGQIIREKYDKYRQINRFLEYIQDILPDLWPEDPAGRPGEKLTIVDFGCGKSYLTFAVHHYLTAICGIPAQIFGLDLKEDVIALCSRLAAEFGCEGLHFAVGDIATFTGAPNPDLIISLHACDTATDYALAQAVRWKTRAILAVPCCQHELNAQLAKKQVDPASPGRQMLEPAFRYGLIRERMAALFTDALRAELLENSGYTVQLLEFIDITHTPKNILIRAVRKQGPANDTAPTPSTRYSALKDFLGVEPTLEKELF